MILPSKIIITEQQIQGINRIKYLTGNIYLKSINPNYSEIYGVKCLQKLPYYEHDLWNLWESMRDAFTDFVGYNVKEKPTTIKPNFIKKCEQHRLWDIIPQELKDTFFKWVEKQKYIIKRSDAFSFYQILKINLEPEEIGFAMFYLVNGKEALHRLGNLYKDLTFTINPNEKYLQGAQHQESVWVHEAYRGMNIGVEMYKFVEQIFGYKIVPVSPLSDSGKKLHQKLGNLK